MTDKLSKLINYLKNNNLKVEADKVSSIIKSSGKKERSAVFDAARKGKFLGYTDRYEGQSTYNEDGYTKKELLLLKRKSKYPSEDIIKGFNKFEKSFIIMGSILAFGEEEYSNKSDQIFEYLLSENMSRKTFEYVNLSESDFNKIILDKNIVREKIISIYDDYIEKRNKDMSNNFAGYITNDIVYNISNGYTLVYVPSANSVLSNGDIAEENKKDDSRVRSRYSKDRETEGNYMGICMGSGQKLYHEDKHRIYSIRDNNNRPKVTIRVTNNELKEVKGMFNGTPSLSLTVLVKEVFSNYLKNIKNISENSDYQDLPPTDVDEVKGRFSRDPDSSIWAGYGKYWFRDKRTPEIKDYIDKKIKEKDFRLISASFPSISPEYFEELAEFTAKSVPSNNSFFLSNNYSDINKSWRYYKKKDWCVRAAKRLARDRSYRKYFFHLSLFSYEPYKNFVSEKDVIDFVSFLQPDIFEGPYVNNMSAFLKAMKKSYGDIAIENLSSKIYFDLNLYKDSDFKKYFITQCKNISAIDFFKNKVESIPEFINNNDVKNIAIDKAHEIDSGNFFHLNLHKDDRFIEIAIVKSRDLDSKYFFKKDLHNQKEFEDVAVVKAKYLSSFSFFRMFNLHEDKKYQSLIPDKVKDATFQVYIAEGFDKDPRFEDLILEKVKSLSPDYFVFSNLYKDHRYRSFSEEKVEGLDLESSLGLNAFMNSKIYMHPEYTKALSKALSRVRIAYFNDHYSSKLEDEGREDLIINSLKIRIISLAKKHNAIRDMSISDMLSIVEYYEYFGNDELDRMIISFANMFSKSTHPMVFFDNNLDRHCSPEIAKLKAEEVSPNFFVSRELFTKFPDVAEDKIWLADKNIILDQVKEGNLPESYLEDLD